MLNIDTHWTAMDMIQHVRLRSICILRTIDTEDLLVIQWLWMAFGRAAVQWHPFFNLNGISIKVVSTFPFWNMIGKKRSISNSELSLVEIGTYLLGH